MERRNEQVLISRQKQADRYSEMQGNYREGNKYSAKMK